MNRAALLIVVLLSLPAIASAQVQTGTPAFNTFGGRRVLPVGPEPRRRPIGMIRSAVGGAGSSYSTSFANGGPYVINLGNLNVHLDIPILSKPGRGGDDFNYDLTYDSSVWQPVGTSGHQIWQPVANWGWAGLVAATSGYYTYGTTTVQVTCTTGGHVYRTYYNDQFNVETYYDSSNTPHNVNGTVQDPVTGEGCVSSSQAPTSLSVVPGDGSGFSYNIQAIDTYPSLAVYTSSGATLSPSRGSPSGSSYVSIDRNGNEISLSSGVFTDTTGNTALTVAGSGTPSSPYTFTYTAPSNAPAAYTVKYSTYSVETSFGCSGILDFGATNESLVSEIDLPDDNPNGTRDRYVFTYESTPGHSGNVTMRVASITLPTGGQILFSYSGGNNGIVCSDGSAAGLTIQTPDGTWGYSRSGATTTVTDAQGNQTVLSFHAASGTFDYFETERQISQLENGVQTPLETIYTCYNGDAMPCTNSNFSLPITEVAEITEPAGSGNLEAEHDSYWNSSGLPTEFADYDYGSSARGPLLREETIQYTSLGNSLHDFSQSTTIYDGSSNIDSQTTYIYDQGTVATTTGTPQHLSVSGSRGNATSISYATHGATTLTRSFTYFDTGNVDLATDVNGAQTTYAYGDCGNSYPTLISEPLSLSRSMTWNCTGGVPATSLDENGQTTTLAWTDPYFWRPASLEDPTNAVTNYSYSLNPTQTESSLNFSSSTVTHLVTLDSMGRPHVAQVLEAPGSMNYDSVETDYDSDGRADKVTLPYLGTNGQTNSSAPGTTTTYDTLGRPMSVTDSGGLSKTYSYSNNNVYETVNAPSTENPKRKQYQYDGLGRLTSVCEITSGTGSGNCPQTNTQQGYYTQYTYNALGEITGVSQSGQARYYTYDEMGRMTSETNPESGVTSYSYDSPTSYCTNSAWNQNAPGQLVQVGDALGNYTCYLYDALKRPISIYVDAGPGQWGNSGCKFFNYDNYSGVLGSRPSGVSPVNVLGRLTEATTTTCAWPITQSAILTDEWFSYDARGELTDLWQSTPHSAGYYHSIATYWANGALDSLNVPGGYGNGYNLDGEGRVYSTGNGNLSGTSYNTASQPLQVNFGSGDGDTFSYDTMNRMQQYTFNIGAQQVVGKLTWNPNWSLGNLTITDPFNSANAQNCSYAHDDLSRIANATCSGSGFSGAYSYDAFGNLDKTGTDTFQPSYNTATNQMTAIGGQPPSYDSDGRILNDYLNSYSWDAYGRPVVINGVDVTYDALGRMVEENNSGAYTEFQYSPTGFKMQDMNGQTGSVSYVPLPGGAMAVWGPNYYRHSDWVGSGRFASNWTGGQMVYDLAYGPFGEPYAQSGSGAAPNFTGKDQQTAANVYDFPAREYGIQGRWPSPDPAGIAAVNPMDPQTWNRYAYVRNNPLSLIDPFGLISTAGFEEFGGLFPEIDGTDGVFAEFNGFLGFSYVPGPGCPLCGEIDRTTPTGPTQGGGGSTSPPTIQTRYQSVDQCLQDSNQANHGALDVIDEASGYGTVSAIGTEAAKEGVTSTVENLANQTASNLEDIISGMAPGFSSGPGPITGYLDNVQFTQIAAETFGAVSKVVSGATMLASVAIRAGCTQLVYGNY